MTLNSSCSIAYNKEDCHQNTEAIDDETIQFVIAMPFDFFVGDCREVEYADAVHLPQVIVIKQQARHRTEYSKEEGVKRLSI